MQRHEQLTDVSAETDALEEGNERRPEVSDPAESNDRHRDLEGSDHAEQKRRATGGTTMTEPQPEEPESECSDSEHSDYRDNVTELSNESCVGGDSVCTDCNCRAVILKALRRRNRPLPFGTPAFEGRLPRQRSRRASDRRAIVLATRRRKRAWQSRRRTFSRKGSRRCFT
jgi:hypothetical protein